MMLVFFPLIGGFAQQLKIYTVNYPLQYMTERISGELAEVTLPMPQGIDPAYWKPKSEAIAAMQSADLIILNGANYAQWVGKHSLPRTKLINSLKNNKEDLIKSGESITHSHGADGEHSHESLAFTTWLDFKLVQEQAKTIHQALVRKLPVQKGLLDRNLKSLIADLQSLDDALMQMKKNWKDEELLASHPVYQYLSKAYDMALTNMHLNPSSYPSKNQWSKIEGDYSKRTFKFMIWEGQPLDDTRSRLKKAGIETIVFDPCANRPKSGDFMSIMQENLKNLALIN